MDLNAAALVATTELEELDPVVREYVRSAIADNTRRAYQSDLRHFIAWGGSIPASDRMIAKYLADHATTLTMATLARRLVAIGKAHTIQGLRSPVSSELVRLTFRGVRHRHGRIRRQVAPITRQELLLMVGQHGASLRDQRDRALFLVGFAGAFRRSELVAINFTDVERVPEGVVVTLRRKRQRGGGSQSPTRKVRSARFARSKAGFRRQASQKDRYFGPLTGVETSALVRFQERRSR